MVASCWRRKGEEEEFAAMLASFYGAAMKSREEVEEEARSEQQRLTTKRTRIDDLAIEHGGKGKRAGLAAGLTGLGSAHVWAGSAQADLSSGGGEQKGNQWGCSSSLYGCK